MSREYEYDNNTDYNPITDSFVNTTPQAGEYVETDNVIPVRETEQQRMERIRREKQEADLNREAKYARMDYESDQERTKARAEMLRKKEEEKNDAIDLARERYLEKSGLYKLFHRRLSNKRAQKMNVSEINNLYGGIEEEKGMSR